jgi:hypothetical protein
VEPLAMTAAAYSVKLFKGFHAFVRIALVIKYDYDHLIHYFLLQYVMVGVTAYMPLPAIGQHR